MIGQVFSPQQVRVCCEAALQALEETNETTLAMELLGESGPQQNQVKETAEVMAEAFLKNMLSTSQTDERLIYISVSDKQSGEIVKDVFKAKLQELKSKKRKAVTFDEQVQVHVFQVNCESTENENCAQEEQRQEPEGEIDDPTWQQDIENSQEEDEIPHLLDDSESESGSEEEDLWSDSDSDIEIGRAHV